MGAQTPMPETVVVGMGDCRVAVYPAIAIATYALGSCMAVMAWDRRLKQGGLVHIMLPDSSIDPGRAKVNPWVYADTGVPELVNRMKSAGSDPRQVRWSMAGGALMLGAAAHFDIGKRNHLALKKVFWRLGIFIEQEDVGGTEPRSARLYLSTGRIDIRKGGGTEIALVPPVVSSLERRTANARPAR